MTVWRNTCYFFFAFMVVEHYLGRTKNSKNEGEIENGIPPICHIGQNLHYLKDK